MISIPVINPYVLAYFCNDAENVADYSIIDNKCYHRNAFIGEISANYDENDNIANYYFLPVNPVQFITLDFTLSPTGEMIFNTPS